MNKIDVINLLSKIPYFSGLDSTALQLISEATLQHTYEEGQFVFMEGEPCIGLYIVEQGWARADFDQVYDLSQKISAEITDLRGGK